MICKKCGSKPYFPLLPENINDRGRINKTKIKKKKHAKQIGLTVIAAAVLFAGCGANETAPAEETSAAPAAASETTESETTVSETTVSDTETSETAISETTAAVTTTLSETTAFETTSKETTVVSETTADVETTAAAISETAASKPEWNEDDMFHYGLTPVQKDGKYGFMNEAGEIVIEPIFDSARSFDVYGLAQIKSGGKIGWVDTEGNITGYYEGDPEKLGEFGIGDFYENGLAPAWGETCGFIDKTGKYVITDVDPIWYYYDEFNQCRFSKGGLAPCHTYPYSYPEWKGGYVDISGKFVIEPTYYEIYNFDDEGMALVVVNDGDISKSKYGFIDESGNFVIEPIYDWAWSFYTPECTYASKDGKGMIINRKGEVITENVGSGIEGAGDNFAFSNGMRRIDNYAQTDADKKFGYIDESGKIVIEPIYSFAYEFSECGLAAACIDGEWTNNGHEGKWVYIDKKGNTVLKLGQGWEPSTFSPEGIALIRNNKEDLAAYIDVKGNYIFEPTSEYSCWYDFSNGLTAVQIGNNMEGKYGYIDTTGKFVIPIQFDRAGSFTPDGYARVSKDGKDFIINKKGENILPEGYSARTSIY